MCQAEKRKVLLHPFVCSEKALKRETARETEDGGETFGRQVSTRVRKLLRDFSYGDLFTVISTFFSSNNKYGEQQGFALQLWGGDLFSSILFAELTLEIQ